MNGSQTESMSRLIKDGKIVGYEWKLQYDNAIKHCATYDEYCYPAVEYSGNIVSLYSTDCKSWVMVEKIKYDSFDMGIKVGDEWWFAGDWGQDKYGDEFILVYSIDRVRWEIIRPHGDFTSSVSILITLKDSKRIGSVYEEGK